MTRSRSLFRRRGKPLDKRLATVDPEKLAGEFTVRLAITLLVSVLVPVILGTRYKDDFPLYAQVLLGLSLAMVGLLAQLLPVVLSIRETRLAEVHMQDARGEAGEIMASIRKSYDDLLLARNPLFAVYFRRDLSRLESQLRQAAQKFELYVDQDSDTTEMMLLPFDGRDEGVIRFVHHVEDNGFLLDVHAREFFTAIVNGVKRRQIHEVRRLIVFGDDSHLATEDSQRLLAFHESEPHFSCKVIERTDFEKMARDSRLPSGKLDFGVYGEWYMYRSFEASPDDISGVFLSGGQELQHYTAFFDRCWRSELAQSPSIDSSYRDTDLSLLFRRRPAPVADHSRALHEPTDGTR